MQFHRLTAIEDFHIFSMSSVRLLVCDFIEEGPSRVIWFIHNFNFLYPYISTQSTATEIIVIFTNNCDFYK